MSTKCNSGPCSCFHVEISIKEVIKKKHWLDRSKSNQMQLEWWWPQNVKNKLLLSTVQCLQQWYALTNSRSHLWSYQSHNLRSLFCDFAIKTNGKTPFKWYTGVQTLHLTWTCICCGSSTNYLCMANDVPQYASDLTSCIEFVHVYTITYTPTPCTQSPFPPHLCMWFVDVSL